MKDVRAVIRFLLLASVLYGIWYSVYEMFLVPKGILDEWVIRQTTSSARALLHLIGYDARIEGRNVFVPLLGGAWIGNPCNGIPLFALFTVFIIAYPGGIKARALFIPLGIISIHLLNILRVTGLILIQIHAPSVMEFNHTFTFTILMYGYIFLLWMIWARKQSDTTGKKIPIA